MFLVLFLNSTDLKCKNTFLVIKEVDGHISVVSSADPICVSALVCRERLV